MIVEIFVYLFLVYLLVGLIFGIWFAFKGAQKVDTGMDGAKLGMRLLLIPGSMGLWPVLLRKYFSRNRSK